MAGTVSPFGLPITYPGQQTAWGLAPHGAQAISMYPSLLQQIPQALQIVHQQLQQLHYLQQQQLQSLQQLLQVVPQQLHQLQQLQHVVQFLPQQIQQLQQQLQSQQVPFGQPAAGLGGPGVWQSGAIPPGFGSSFQSTPFLGSQGLTGQPGLVM